MIVYLDKEGQPLRAGEPFERDGIAFSANWLELALSEDLERFGFSRIEEPDPEPTLIPPAPEPTISEKLESIGVSLDDLKKALGL